MKILISGNPEFGLAKATADELQEHELTFVSRTTHKLDLTKAENQQVFEEDLIKYVKERKIWLEILLIFIATII